MRTFKYQILLEKMKVLLSILVIIGNLTVLLANNDNCRENDLNAIMVRLRQLRTEFNNLKIQHDDRIDQINATQAVLTEANDTQETELKKLRQEFHNTSSELEKLRQEFHNTSSELDKLRQEFYNTSSELENLRHEFHNTSSELDRLRQEFHNTSSELEKLRRNTSSEIAAIKDKSILPIVGFNANLISIAIVYGGDKVVFDGVWTNKGGGYNSSAGIFTAPYTGLYFFSVHVCNQGDKFVQYAIKKEFIQLVGSTQYGQNSNYSCSSVSVITMVDRADRVWVEALTISVFYNGHYNWNTFSGSLLNK